MYRWIAMTHITDMHGNLKGQGQQAALDVCSSHYLQGRGILGRPHYRPHSLYVGADMLLYAAHSLLGVHFFVSGNFLT